MSPEPHPQVSVVVPLYNEEENVGPLCKALRAGLAGWERPYEIVLVDDGSSDGTLDRLRAEVARDSSLRVLALRRNSGQTVAMATGFVHARGEIVVSMDGDLQNDPRDIPLLVERLEQGHDLVCGWRKARQDAFLLRVFPSKVANWLIARITGVPIHDNGCSLKAYRADLIRSLRLYSDMHRFLPALSSMAGARIAEVVVRHHPRTRGESKYGLKRIFLVLGDMFTIKMLTHFGNRPGRWFASLSLPWLALGLATLLVWSVGRWSLGLADSIVLPSLSVMFFYLAGHLLGLAMLGEILLAHADRGYLQRLAELLTTVETLGPPSKAEERR